MHCELEALCCPRTFPVLPGNPLIQPACLCFQRLRKLLTSRSFRLSGWTTIWSGIPQGGRAPGVLGPGADVMLQPPQNTAEQSRIFSSGRDLQ